MEELGYDHKTRLLEDTYKIIIKHLVKNESKLSKKELLELLDGYLDSFRSMIYSHAYNDAKQEFQKKNCADPLSLVVKSEDEDIYFNSHFFSQLFKAQKGKLIDKKVLTSIVGDLLSDKDIVGKLFKTEAEALDEIKKQFYKFSTNIDEACEEYHKALKDIENSDEAFINGFKDPFKLPKTEISDLCEKGETWAHLHKKEFKNDSSGVYVKDFLKWLIVYNEKTFQTFKRNWKNKPQR